MDWLQTVNLAVMAAERLIEESERSGGMSRKPEESLRSYAKQVLDVFVRTRKGRYWVAFLLAYGVVGPIILALILPSESEGGFWAAFGREVMEGGPFALVGILLAIFLITPLWARRRQRKAAKGNADDE